MSAKTGRIVRNTAEEGAEIARQIAENPDEAEWTDEAWANAKSTEELFPEAAKAARKRQADLDAGRTEHITLLLDRDTINWFKTQTGEDGDSGGTKWMNLAEKTLREHARQEGIARQNSGGTRASLSDEDTPGSPN